MIDSVKAGLHTLDELPGLIKFFFDDEFDLNTPENKKVLSSQFTQTILRRVRELANSFDYKNPVEIKKKIDYYLHFAEIGEDLDKRNYYVSYEKLNALGFKTTISLQKGIDDLISGLSLINVREGYSNV